MIRSFEMVSIHTLKMSISIIPAGAIRAASSKVVPNKGHAIENARFTSLSGSSFWSPNQTRMTSVKNHIVGAYSIKTNNVALTDPNFSSRKILGTMMPNRLMQLSFAASYSAIRSAAPCKQGLVTEGFFHLESFKAKNAWLSQSVWCISNKTNNVRNEFITNYNAPIPPRTAQTYSVWHKTLRKVSNRSSQSWWLTHKCFHPKWCWGPISEKICTWVQHILACGQVF